MWLLFPGLARFALLPFQRLGFLQRCAGAKIKNDHVLARFLLSTEFVYRDPRHAQFTQKTVPLPVLEPDVTNDQCGNQSQGVSTHTAQRVDNLLYLVAEEITQ